MQPKFRLVEVLVRSGAFAGTRLVFEGSCSEVIERAAAYERDKIVGVSVRASPKDGWRVEGWLKNGKAY